jgi:hypothetical protein
MPAVPSALAARRELQRRRRVQEAGQAALRRSVGRLSRAQRRFFQSKHFRRALTAGRQAGKTHLCLLLLVEAALRPNTLSLYFAPTRNAARSILWEKLKRWLKDAGLAVEFNESLLEARFANGSIIRLLGVPDITRAERHRGLTVNGVVVVDEAAFFGEAVFHHLLTSIIPPYFMTTRRKARGIACVSSPGLVPRGHFHRIATDTTLNWDRHTFTVRDNPVVDDPDGELAELREANGWSLTSPGYLREGEAQWIADTDLNVYDITAVNIIDSLPPGPWTTLLTFDQGTDDPDVVGILGWREHDPALYLLYVEWASGNDVTDLAEIIKRLRDEYKPWRIIGDLGALGKKTALEMRNRHRLPIEAADKAGKPVAIRQLNADARRGLLLIPSAYAQVIQQMQDLKWDPKHVSQKEHPAMPNDLCDMVLYGHRMARHYRAELAPTPAPPDGSDEAIKQLEEKIQRENLERIERERRIANGDEDEPTSVLDELDDLA